MEVKESLQKYIGLFEELYELHGNKLFDWIHIDNSYDFLKMCKQIGYKPEIKLVQLINNYHG